MYRIREATHKDIDFLTEADLLVGVEDEPETADAAANMTPRERADHRQKIGAFIGAADKGAWICEDEHTGENGGMILCRFRNRWRENFSGPSSLIFQMLEPSIFPADGAFCEIFQLWVHPAHRRQGLARRLKKHLEQVVRDRGISMIYTHTLARNHYVLTLNRKLGYREVRRGPIWDDWERVSLVKYLPPAEGENKREWHSPGPPGSQ